jgi:hypothetical protein
MTTKPYFTPPKVGWSGTWSTGATMKIDRKFKFVAVNPCNQKVYTEENAIILCAKDRAVVPAMQAYLVACRDLGCGAEHLESVELLINRVKLFQAVESRVPDTETDCEIDRCIGGNTD